MKIRCFRTIKRHWIVYLLYLSILFALVNLAKGNYLYIPTIHNYMYLSLSVVFLCVGFVLCAPQWKLSLLYNEYNITFRDSIISIGLSVFSKYIPGKIWSILGPAAYVAQTYGLPAKQLAHISLDNQLIMLWSGLILGAAGLFVSGIPFEFPWIVLAFWVFLSLVIFSNVFHEVAKSIILRIFNKSVEIPKLSLLSTVKTLPFFFLNWFAWCLAFYFFSQSLVDYEITFSVGLGFSLAATIGMLSIVAPGGIGVRESILFGYLVGSGLGIDEATIVAITSRLWFLLGEGFIFFYAVALKRL